ncbi:RecQ family ATP-dependent DNA helicase [Conexibacter sp. JD483]|uniref:RecQ family ATP-dependent DNA helicase n=1 Tax=unclassified Conexibacter TaxID=2627773 RepID=UPI0027243956|nr:MULTISPECIES: RecQ family ATP-dependent DNA helicase [unclassified Conexibacter]MDO8189106.1 RecQ family ATP-dependent DNA helicase [Conexibacter sp. CPCC 205706]MDO8200846.1 RecQ family ATP-dependent DNA helicase [Conexibacter sp. CPCC 205762]MDR9371721.1 RecQ family ATP-dependent DNA helicase [Conexibacter sp. JD483]
MTADRIDRTARDAFGFAALRPGQRQAIEALLAGHDTLAVLASGAGKSAIYQIAALLIEGPTLVISPLIALQQDQSQAIERHLPGEAAPLNSRLGGAARRRTLKRLEEGAVEFLFLAPEQLANAEVRAELALMQPSLLVVDEAHCISEWGHDFRPEYLRIGPLVEQLGHPTTLALTATAAPPVRREIAERLHLRDPAEIVRGFDRPEIRLSVERHHDERRKQEALLEHVARLAKPGIVYCATRRAADACAAQLAAAGWRAAAYHAGHSSSERDDVQGRFMEGALDVVVATTAFGMGVDTPHVRFVLHQAVSESLDAYYQEIGRAARDRLPAEAILLYRPEDLGTRRFLRGAGPLTPSDLDRVARAVADAGTPLPADTLREALAMSRSKLTAAVTRLEDAGELAVRADGSVARAPCAPPVDDAVAAAVDADEQRETFALSRLAMVRAYAETAGCRRRFLLSYFGERAPERCGNCDGCTRLDDAADDDLLPAPQHEQVADRFPPGCRVRHHEWGGGEVQRVDGDHLIVLFDDVGYKTLGGEIVASRHLLERL